MQTRAPSRLQLSVIAVFAASCFGLLTFLWLSFGGTVPFEGKGYQFRVTLLQANQLAVESDVRISGVNVGSVVGLAPGSDGHTVATVQLDRQYAPIHTDATAELRIKSLLGETYIALDPGLRTAPVIPDGGTLGAAQVVPAVALDQIYRAFDPRTRLAFEAWMASAAEGVAGNGEALNTALGELAPFSDDLARVTATFAQDDGSIVALVRNAGIVIEALRGRDAQLGRLVTAAHDTFAATAAASSALARSLAQLPGFERHARSALAQLDAFTADANPLLTELVPSAAALTPLLRQLTPLAPPLARLTTGLGPLTQAARSGLPSLDAVLTQLRPVLDAATPTLDDLNPLLTYADLYQPEIDAFFANVASVSEAIGPVNNEAPASNQLLHYIRGEAGPLNPASLGPQTFQYGSDRTNPYAPPAAAESLASGLPSFTSSHCANPTPTLATSPTAGVSQAELQLFTALGIARADSGSQTAAPPCTAAPTVTFEGLSTTFPHVGSN